jgi:hypothetical protein
VHYDAPYGPKQQSLDGEQIRAYLNVWIERSHNV